MQSGLTTDYRKGLSMALGHDNVVGAFEAKTHFSELLERIEKGEEVTITKHGTPVAKLVPIRKKSTVEERRAAIERWQDMSDPPTLGGLKARDLIEEGRR
jgi:prevent-host-death family protein